MNSSRKAYATPEDVFDLLGILDADTGKPVIPDNTTYPTYDALNHRLQIESEKFDSLTHDTWDVKQVKDFIFDREIPWTRTNMSPLNIPFHGSAWEMTLLHPIVSWDTEKGDKLEIMDCNTNQWRDVSAMVGTKFWFDYQGGLFYYKYGLSTGDIKFRITYRYGRNEEPPMDVQDAVCKQVAIWVMQTDWYRTKIGGGGDLSSKRDTINEWKEDYKFIVYSHANNGEAISLLP